VFGIPAVIALSLRALMPSDRYDSNRTRAAKTAGKKNPAPGSPPNEASVSHLSALLEGRPKTKSGQIRWLWPNIKAALRDGHQLKHVWECLVQDGVNLSYSKLRWYVARLRKLEAAGADLPGDGTEPEVTRALGALPNGASNSDTPKRDALANLRDRMNKRPGFEFDERPPDEKKLI
jgi:hypothetical protein